MTAPAMTEASLLQQCEDIWAATREHEADERRKRQAPPVIRLWDGDFNLQHICRGQETFFSVDWIDLDSGPGELRVPFDHPTGQWLWDARARLDAGQHRGIHMSVDHVGMRWCGRVEDVDLQRDSNGEQTIVIRLLSDYEELKWYQVWSNPFLLAQIQIPRVFLLAGPVGWVASTTLMFQLIRENLSLWSIPDDPLNPDTWGALDMSNWNVVVKPKSFIASSLEGQLWGIVASRFKNYHDAFQAMLQDAEITPVLRRYFDGDDPPWPGARLKHGALVVDFQDKSGFYTGTSLGGSLFSGITRGVSHFLDGFMDTEWMPLDDNDIPGDYFLPGWKGTHKSLPSVIYIDSEISGIDSYTHKQKMGKGVQLVVGGHSMPGVNEAISAAIQALGDVLGGLAQIGSIGGSVDTLLKPFYEDTILAWFAYKSLLRAADQGWARYFEYMADGSSKAYTIASLLSLRAADWSTRPRESNEVNVRDGAPWLIGDLGEGHFTYGDRIGYTVRGDTKRRVFIDRVSRINLSGEREKWPEFVLDIGRNRDHDDPIQKIFTWAEDFKSSLSDLGVF